MSIVPTTPTGALPAGGTGDPTRGLAVVIDKLVSLALDSTGSDGATLDQHGLPYRGSGVIVALSEYSAPKLSLDVLRGLERSQVEWLVGSWVRGRSQEVVGQFLRPRYYGAWIDSGTLYLDVVEAWPGDRELDAIRAGRERNQISVWHAGRGVEVQCGGTGEVTERAPFRS